MSLAAILIIVVQLSPAVESDTASSLVWPPPPEQARIRHLQTISSAADLHVESGLFDKLLGILFGGRDQSPWLVQPVGIAVSKEGTIAIADPGAQGVHLINPQEKTYRFLSQTESGVLASPVAAAFSSDGSLYISDSQKGLVAVYDEDFDPAFVISQSLQRPTGLVFSGDTLYVVDTGQHKIVCFDRRGRYLMEFGRRGSGAGEFNFPVQLAFDGTLYVVDALNYRVQRFSRAGEFLSAFGRNGTTLGSFAGPKSIALDSDGHLYVTDALLDNFQIFDSLGRLLLAIGAKGGFDGEFMSPGGIAIDGQDRIYVIDTLNRRIQIFRYMR